MHNNWAMAIRWMNWVVAFVKHIWWRGELIRLVWDFEFLVLNWSFTPNCFEAVQRFRGVALLWLWVSWCLTKLNWCTAEVVIGDWCERTYNWWSSLSTAIAPECAYTSLLRGYHRIPNYVIYLGALYQPVDRGVTIECQTMPYIFVPYTNLLRVIP